MKKFLIILLAFMLVFSITGCGMSEKAAEKAAEKIIKSATGADVDISGDKVTVKGEDGEVVTFGDTKWPKSDLAKNVPEIKVGKITSVLESPDIVIITIELTKKDDTSSYYKKIKEEFPIDAYETKTEDMVSFGGENDAGVHVSLVSTSEMFMITIAKSVQ